MSDKTRRLPFFMPESLHRKIKKCIASGQKSIKTHSRNATIIPDMIGMVINVHNGKSFLPVYVTETMIGHKLGEFVLTRKKPVHTNKSKETDQKNRVKGGKK